MLVTALLSCTFMPHTYRQAHTPIHTHTRVRARTHTHTHLFMSLSHTQPDRHWQTLRQRCVYHVLYLLACRNFGNCSGYFWDSGIHSTRPNTHVLRVRHGSSHVRPVCLLPLWAMLCASAHQVLNAAPSQFGNSEFHIHGHVVEGNDLNDLRGH